MIHGLLGGLATVQPHEVVTSSMTTLELEIFVTLKKNLASVSPSLALYSLNSASQASSSAFVPGALAGAGGGTGWPKTPLAPAQSRPAKPRKAIAVVRRARKQEICIIKLKFG